MSAERSLARIKDADIGEVYNGMLGLVVTFKYEDGSEQRLNDYFLEAGLVIRFMEAIGVLWLRNAIGKSCWITHGLDNKILVVEPLHKGDGVPLDIEKWSVWAREKLPALSYADLAGRSR